MIGTLQATSQQGKKKTFFVYKKRTVHGFITSEIAWNGC